MIKNLWKIMKKYYKMENKNKENILLILMTAMLESQIALKLLTKSILFSSSKRIKKVIKKTNIVEVGKVIYKYEKLL